ncbi:MAG: gluconate 2-dehydrogenase subunit 3 family protein [Actinomycetota bacterium]
MGKGIGRRKFLGTVGAAAAGAGLAGSAAAKAAPKPDDTTGQRAATAPAPPAHEHKQPQPGGDPNQAWLFFNDQEAAFITAAVDVLIPADDAGPGGVESGVVHYIDRQLAGAFGTGARMYLSGPWGEGTPQQGYQLPLIPQRLYRVAMRDADAVLRAANGVTFTQLDPQARSQFLAALQSGATNLRQVPGKAFVDMLLANAIEGYFADPAYGGNRDMAAWKMIGFPGTRGAYADEIVSYRNKPFPAQPTSLADLQ